MSLDPHDAAVLDFLLDAAEPTWILLEEMPELEGDRPRLEATFRRLEQRGLVTRSRELSVNPARPSTDLDDWWELTKEGWAAQGLEMPSSYGRRGD